VAVVPATDVTAVVVAVGTAPVTMENVRVAVALDASVTRTMKEVEPSTLGVPLMVPLPESSVSPAGSVPLAIAQEYGAWPPPAESVLE
jgi:hypothetical protein